MTATTGASNNGRFLRLANTLVLWCCWAGVAPPSVGAVDPAFAKNLTVFHINPLAFGPVPLNMDVGDAAGDLFFDLWDVVAYPIACPDGPNQPTPSGGHGHNNCGNPETFGNNLVVNKLTIEVDSRFSGYAKCNIGVNGTDGRGHPCEDNTYCCFCGGYESPHPEPCNATIGFENVSSFFGGQSGRVCTVRNASDPVELATCWKENSVHKFGGDEYYGGWYSPQDLGCADPLHPTDNCTWRVVSTDAVINRTCHNEQFFAAVAEYNPPCFDACPAGGNTSDFCHIKCFYETALGPGASGSGSDVNLTSGIPTPALVEAWMSGFRDEASGGCPRIITGISAPTAHHDHDHHHHMV